MNRFFLKVAALCALAALVGSDPAASLTIPSAGDPFPTFSLPGADGALRSIEEIRGNRPMILSFFRTDCKPCKKELPHLQSLYESHGDRLAVVVLVLDTRGNEAFEPFRKEHGITFPVLNDAKKVVTSRLGVSSLPTIFLVDGMGRIKERLVGYDSANGEKFEEAMLSKLGFSRTSRLRPPSGAVTR